MNGCSVFSEDEVFLSDSPVFGRNFFLNGLDSNGQPVLRGME